MCAAVAVRLACVCCCCMLLQRGCRGQCCVLLLHAIAVRLQGSVQRRAAQQRVDSPCYLSITCTAAAPLLLLLLLLLPPPLLPPLLLQPLHRLPHALQASLSLSDWTQTTMASASGWGGRRCALRCAALWFPDLPVWFTATWPAIPRPCTTAPCLLEAPPCCCAAHLFFLAGGAAIHGSRVH